MRRHASKFIRAVCIVALWVAVTYIVSELIQLKRDVAGLKDLIRDHREFIYEHRSREEIRGD